MQRLWRTQLLRSNQSVFFSLSHTKYANKCQFFILVSMYWMNIIACTTQMPRKRNGKTLKISYKNMLNKKKMNCFCWNWNDTHRLSCRKQVTIHNMPSPIDEWGKNWERKKKREETIVYHSTKLFNVSKICQPEWNWSQVKIRTFDTNVFRQTLDSQL